MSFVLESGIKPVYPSGGSCFKVRGKLLFDVSWLQYVPHMRSESITAAFHWSQRQRAASLLFLAAVFGAVRPSRASLHEPVQ